MTQMESVLKAAHLKPPSPETLAIDNLDNDLFALLIHTGTLIRLQNVSLNQSLVFHADALRDAVKTLKSIYPDGAAFTTGEARATLKTTRKYIVPLLEHFDAIGVTIRNGETRHLI